MFSDFRDDGRSCSLTAGIWPFRTCLQFDRNSGALDIDIVKGLRRKRTINGADIRSVKYAEVGAWYTEVYLASWKLKINVCGKSQLLLSTIFRNERVHQFTTALSAEIEML